MIEKINFEYMDNKELYLYLNDLSLMIYGCDYNELHFLNNNCFDFSKKNVLIKNC